MQVVVVVGDISNVKYGILNERKKRSFFLKKNSKGKGVVFKVIIQNQNISFLTSIRMLNNREN